jgi:hypothetical protein
MIINSDGMMDEDLYRCCRMQLESMLMRWSRLVILLPNDNRAERWRGVNESSSWIISLPETFGKSSPMSERHLRENRYSWLPLMYAKSCIAAYPKFTIGPFGITSSKKSTCARALDDGCDTVRGAFSQDCLIIRAMSCPFYHSVFEHL